MLRPALLGVAVLLAGSLASCGGGGDSAAGCIAVVEVDGVSYYGDSAPRERVPVTGEVVDAVLPGCNDTGGADEPDERMKAQVIWDVPTDVAVLHDGTLHIREGARMPASAGSWFDSASCTGSGEFRLAGRWVGVSEPAAPHFDGVLDAPYDVVLRVDDGFAPYVGSTLEVQVTGETDPVLARSDLPRLDDARLRARVRCLAGSFVAVGLRMDR